MAFSNLTNSVSKSIAKRNRTSARRRSAKQAALVLHRNRDDAEEEVEETGELDSCCGPEGADGSSCARDDYPPPDSSPGSSVRASLCERLNPHEHQLAYISPDGREGHFIVAARTHQTYHSSPRDFVFVGFRFLLCRGGSKVLVGWCGAERDCPEPPSRRDLFPGHDCPDFHPSELQPSSCICPCAYKLLQHLGGASWLTHILAMREGGAKEQYEHGQSLLGELKVHGRSYIYVNPRDGGLNLFRQWGVVRSMHEGYSCQVCEGRPRHCRHTQVIVGGGAGHGGSARHMPRKDFDEKIRRAIDPLTGQLRVKSISQQQLPFFPEDDDVMLRQLQGESMHVFAPA